MNTIRKSRWLIRTVSTALAVAILVGGLGMSTTGTASARKRAHAELVQGFSNPTAIAIPDNAVGVTAQTTIFVSGFETELADVDVTLNNLSHGLPADIDMLLVGPGGQTALILSDVAAANAANNITLTLDDQAPNQVSSFAPLTNGTFQPTNVQSGSVFDGFFPPAPQSPPSGSELGVFNSTDPNGIWSLFLLDDNPSGTGGTLSGGWSLKITSANGIPDAAPDSFSANAGKQLSVNASGVLENDTDLDDDSLTAILAGQPTKGKVNLEVDGSFTYKSSKKAKGTDSFTYLAKDPGGLSDLETVTIQIKKAKKKGKK